MTIKDTNLPNEILDNITNLNIETKLPVETDSNGMDFINLMSNVSIPYNINPMFYTIYQPTQNESFQTISYKFYGTIKLWWFICKTNHLLNITEGANANVPLKIIKKEYVYNIIKEL